MQYRLASFQATGAVPPFVLRNGRRADGRQVDVLVRAGQIAAVASPGQLTAEGGSIDLAGYLLTPSLVEPHCHLDKAFTDELIGTPEGDVAAASRAWHAFRRDVDFDAVATRARLAVEHLLANGVTAIRTHVDVGRDSGAAFVTAIDALRSRFEHAVDLQIVAFVDNPLTGEVGRQNLAILEQSLGLGADVIGGAPYQNGDWHEFQDLCMALSRERGFPVDFHTDETTDPAVLTLPRLIRQARAFKSPSRITASHCVSLGVQDAASVARIADDLAEAGIAVVTLPLCNLFLQGRGAASGKPRGLAPLQALVARGVTLAAGGDNYRDPFNPVGRCDPLEVASLLVTAGHLSPEKAFECVTSAAREAMGLPAVDVAPGFSADLMAIRAATLREAIAFAGPDRLVFRKGRLVAATQTQRSLFT